MIRTGLFRYVRHADVFSFMERGWMVAADLGPTHGQWSVLMWHCECGEHDPENLTVACVNCNLSKGAKSLEEWMGAQ